MVSVFIVGTCAVELKLLFICFFVVTSSSAMTFFCIMAVLWTPFISFFGCAVGFHTFLMGFTDHMAKSPKLWCVDFWTNLIFMPAFLGPLFPTALAYLLFFKFCRCTRWCSFRGGYCYDVLFFCVSIFFLYFRVSNYPRQFLVSLIVYYCVY